MIRPVIGSLHAKLNNRKGIIRQFLSLRLNIGHSDILRLLILCPPRQRLKYDANLSVKDVYR